MDIVDKFLKDDFVDQMVWSFSRLSSFHNCKRGWYINYIDGIRGKENFFSQFGTFGHTIFESYDKGELALSDISNFIEKRYFLDILLDAPGNNWNVDIKLSYYGKLMNYFEKFVGHDDETIGVEEEARFDIDYFGGKKPCVGFIDRVSRDKDGIIITDYKSRNKFKSGELAEYARQPYLYSTFIKDKYGEFPHTLKFEMFKIGETVEIPFDYDDFLEAHQWAANTIKMVYDEELFLPKDTSDFFCWNICGVKDECGIMRREAGAIDSI